MIKQAHFLSESPAILRDSWLLLRQFFAGVDFELEVATGYDLPSLIYGLIGKLVTFHFRKLLVLSKDVP